MAQTIYSGELNTGIRSGEVRAPYPAVLVDGGICHLMGFSSLEDALRARAEDESFADFLAFEFQDGCWRPEGWMPAVESVAEPPQDALTPESPIEALPDVEALSKTEVQVKIDEPAKPEEPATVEQPAKAEEPANAEPPAKTEEPIVAPEMFNAEDASEADDPEPEAVEPAAAKGAIAPKKIDAGKEPENHDPKQEPAPFVQPSNEPPDDTTPTADRKRDPGTREDLFGDSPKPAKKKPGKSRARKPRKPKK